MQSGFYPKSKVNVGQKERVISALGGGGLILYALIRPSRGSLLSALGGGYLIYRGLTGHDIVYEVMGITRAGTNGHAGIRVERALTVNRPRHEVYAFWKDFQNFSSFMKHIESVEVLPDGRSHWITKGPVGTKIEWDAEITDERENRLISWRSLPGSEVENSGTVRFEDAPGGRGTEVHVMIKYNPPGGSASAAFAALLGKEPNQQVRDDLRRFKEVVETGEVASVLGQTSGRKDQTERERVEIRRRRRKDVVQEASEESFPASDAPGWTGGPEL